MKLDAIVFDIAGTTLIDDDAVSRTMREVLRDLRGVVVTPDAVRRAMGLRKPDTIRLLLEGAGQAADARVIAQLLEEFIVRMQRHYREDPHVKETEGASDVFRALRARGIKVALDTGFDRRIVDVVIERTGWQRDQLLDAVVASDEVVNSRPHPDMILRVMALLGLRDPKRVGKVGDTAADLEEGQQAGCGLVAGVTSGSHTRAQLEPHPHTHLIASLRELLAIVDGR